MLKRFLIIVTLGLLLLSLISCSKSYFTIAEEVHENTAIKYKTVNSFYEMGKSIELTRGKFQLIPGDSIVLFIEGRSTKSTVSGETFAELPTAKSARFFVTLPISIAEGKYNTTHKAICEIIGSLNYQTGEGLFTCQSGEVVIDSLKGEKLFGSITGKYRNTKNQSLTVNGNIEANIR
ncbi:MAG: hypothetical protein KAR42_16555 [candidate division Zixibacteria bacterium]|nr:hypothetical protein [candidate division Zixibacteria bacterium]